MHTPRSNESSTITRQVVMESGANSDDQCSRQTRQLAASAKWARAFPTVSRVVIVRNTDYTYSGHISWPSRPSSIAMSPAMRYAFPKGFPFLCFLNPENREQCFQPLNERFVASLCGLAATAGRLLRQPILSSRALADQSNWPGPPNRRSHHRA